MRKIIENNQYWVIFCILLVGLLVRVYRLNLNIPPLFADETVIHYSIWSQLLTPGNNFFGELFKWIVYGPWTFTWFLGLTPLGVRLPAALYGTALILLMYYFARLVTEQFKDKTLSRDNLLPLVSASLLMISPWAFMLSRIGYSAALIMLIMVFLYLIIYLNNWNRGGIKKIIFMFTPLFIGTFYYPSMLVIAPIILIFLGGELIMSKISTISRYQTVILIGLAVTSLVFLGLKVFYNFAGITVQQSRGADLAIWKDINVTADSNLYRGLAKLSEPTLFSFNQNPEISNRLVYNYPLSVIQVFVKNYLSFFSPDFLFLRGDPVLRHSTGQAGVFLPILLPFLVYGTFLFFRNGNQKIKRTFLLWILISPIPAAITKDGYGYLLRIVTMLPFLTYLIGLGLVGSYEIVKNQKVKVGYIIGTTLLITFSFYYFLYGYFHVYPALSARSFEYGFKELSDFQQTHNLRPLLVVWETYWPSGHFRFWQGTSARDYRNFVPIQLRVGETIFFKMYNNLYFALPKTEEDLESFVNQNNILYTAVAPSFVTNHPEYKLFKNFPIQIIHYPDQSDVFYIFSSDEK